MSHATGPRSATVGVVGLGAMGLPIATALAARRPVVAHDASPAVLERAAAAGLRVAGTLVEVARTCSTVILSLPSADVGEQVVAALTPEAPGLLVLDTSTVGPDDARRLGALARSHGSTYLDTPILGRPESVGAWTVPVGGPAAAYAAVARVLEPVADRVVHVGDLGAGATLKVVNNLMFSVINAVTAEALLLAEAAGLDPGVFVDTVMDSGAATVSGLFRSIAPRAVDGDFTPTFTLDLVRKDNDLAVRLAESAGIDLAVGGAALAVHRAAVEAGHGAEDSVAVLRMLEERSGRTARRHDRGRSG